MPWTRTQQNLTTLKTEKIMSWITLSCEGELVCIQPEDGGGCWRIDIGVYDTCQLSTTDSFLLAAPQRECELLTARRVMDENTGLQVPMLVFRCGDERTAYYFGVLDTSARAFACWQQFELSSNTMYERIEVYLCDGPVLCVSRSLLREGSVELTIASCAGAMFGGTSLNKSHAGLRTVVFPCEEARLLCACSLSGYPNDTSLLLLTREKGSCQVVALSVRTCKSQQSHNISSPHTSALHSQAIATMAAVVSCVAPHWVYKDSGAPHRPGVVENELQLWVGTTTAMLHLCSLDGRAVRAFFWWDRM